METELSTVRVCEIFVAQKGICRARFDYNTSVYLFITQIKQNLTLMLLWQISEAISSGFSCDHEENDFLIAKMKSLEIYYDGMIGDNFYVFP